MKFDRFAMVALLALGLGCGVSACDGDDEEDVDSCGNGVLDEGEVCDTVNGEIKFADDSKATCELAEQGKFGKPGCAKDCRGYSKGSCSDVKPISSCKAELKKDGNKVSIVSAELGEGENGTKMLQCGPVGTTLEAVLSEVKSVDSVDVDFKDAGDYGCFVVVAGDDKVKHFCSESGALSSIDNDHKTIGSVSILKFKVESSVAAGVLAKWVFTNAEKTTIQNELKAGVAAEEGSDNAVKMSWVPVGDGESNISIVTTMDANGGMTALQIKVTAAGNFTDKQLANDNSHISIGDLSKYAVSKLSLTARYEGAKLYVTEVADNAEKVVRTLDLTKDYASYSVEGFTAGAANINLYGDAAAAKAISIDDLTIEGAAK